MSWSVLRCVPFTRNQPVLENTLISFQKIQGKNTNSVAKAFAVFPEGAFPEDIGEFNLTLAPGPKNITKQVIEDLKQLKTNVSLNKYFPSIAISPSKAVKLKPQKVFEVALPVLNDLASFYLKNEKLRYAVFYQVYDYDQNKIMSGLKLRDSVKFLEEDDNFLSFKTRYFGIYQAAVLTQESYNNLDFSFYIFMEYYCIKTS